MRLLVINNRSSGLGDNSIYDFLRIIGDDGDEAVIRNTHPDVPLADLLRDAEDFDHVVASGGDGTIASVCYELRYRDVSVVPFPAGTGNLLSMNLSSPEEPRAIAEMVKKGNVEQYDMGEIEYTDPKGEPQTHGFAIMAGAGFDAMIMDGAAPLKGLLGHHAYYVSALFGDKPQKSEIRLTIDGEVHETSGIAIMLVNFGKIAPDISVTHVNDAQDGLLEVVVLTPDSRVQLAPALIAAFLDRRGQFPSRSDAMEIYAGREITVEADPPLPIQFDGEVANALTPFRARSLHQALRAVVDDEEVERLETLRLLDAIEEGQDPA